MGRGETETATRTATRTRTGLIVLVVACACQREAAKGPAEKPAPAPVVAAVPAAPAAAAPEAPSVADEELVEEAPESNPTSETVTIRLVAEPARKARVFWGRKDLGLAPLELTRPRGSGPLDLVVVAPGALTLHTRVFTDRDDKLALRLYGLSEAPGLLGYREEPTPPAPVSAPQPARRKASPRATP